jgi:hypothetical protein
MNNLKKMEFHGQGDMVYCPYCNKSIQLKTLNCGMDQSIAVPFPPREAPVSFKNYRQW